MFPTDESQLILIGFGHAKTMMSSGGFEFPNAEQSYIPEYEAPAPGDWTDHRLCHPNASVWGNKLLISSFRDRVFVSMQYMIFGDRLLEIVDAICTERNKLIDGDFKIIMPPLKVGRMNRELANVKDTRHMFHFTVAKKIALFNFCS